MNGLLLSDSLLKNIPTLARDELQLTYALDSLDAIAYPGYTTERLIGREGVIHDLLKSGNVSHVFLCSGANDFNKCEQATSDRKARFVADGIQGNLHSFCAQYPEIKVVFFPIPFRQVCHESRRNKRYPNNYDVDWISTTNAAIQSFQAQFHVCKCHQSQCSWVVSPPCASWVPLLELDGLHLTSQGKNKLVQLVCDSKPHNDFNPSDSCFPALSKPGRSFSFEPQVTLPIIKRVSRTKPIFLSIQSLYFGHNRASNVMDSKPSEPPKPGTVPVLKSTKPRRRRKKKTN